MTDAQLFLCIVLFFYFSGRCLWRPARTIAFRAIFFTPYRPVVESSVLGNQFGSVLFPDLFLPLNPIYLAYTGDVLFAPEGIALAKDGDAIAFPSALSWMPYEDIVAVTRSERTVTINWQISVRFRTAGDAAALVARLDGMRHEPRHERANKISHEMKRAFNLPEARRILRKTRSALATLRWSANLWLAGILVAYLITALRFGYATMTLFLLLALEAAAIHLGIQFYRVHRRFYPEEGRFRAAELLKFVCCSPTAFHCVDAISSGLFARFHPLVIAQLICERSEFDRHCTRWVRSVKYARIGASENENWIRAESERLIAVLLQTLGRPIERYVGAPARVDPETKSYCPRCEAQYQFAPGLCPDCDVPLLAFPGGACALDSMATTK
jgi:hypothetical protein